MCRNFLQDFKYPCHGPAELVYEKIASNEDPNPFREQILFLKLKYEVNYLSLCEKH